MRRRRGGGRYEVEGWRRVRGRGEEGEKKRGKDDVGKMRGGRGQEGKKKRGSKEEERRGKKMKGGEGEEVRENRIGIEVAEYERGRSGRGRRE